MKLVLQLEDGTYINMPMVERIEKALHGLSFDSDNGFAILSRGDQTYIQCATTSWGQFVLEYQEGSLDQHFQATDPVELDDVLVAFRAYALGRAWKDRFTWRKLDLG